MKGILFPSYIRVLFQRLGIAMLLLSVSRLLFFLQNKSYFQQASVWDFIMGLRFDASIVAYFFSVFILLSLLPVSLLKKYKSIRITQAFFYFFPLAVALFANLCDGVYFRFIFRRSTYDVFRYFSSPEADGWRLFYTFLVDFWYVPLLFILLLLVAIKAYKSTANALTASPDKIWKLRAAWTLFLSGVLIVAGRGGLQLLPITLVDAGHHTAQQSMPLVLNTPFSIMVTAFQQGREPVFYYKNKEEAERYFSLNYQVKPYAVSFKGRNVVLLILESFGKEYVGFYNKGKGYTPFLDSLLGESYVFVNSFSNGKQSIDALPALLSGIPALMQEPYINSRYSTNQLPSLVSYFNQQGYETQFFHGGANGTMGFEPFVSSLGMKHYYGKDEYPNVKKDYDGNWGIFDEPYLNYFAKKLTENERPFFSAVFTLSSHHPYTIPERYKGKFPKGHYAIHESIGYADYSLGKFFEQAKQEPWFNNTLFILTADHTAHSDVFFYQNGMGMYNVPIAFFDPQQKMKGIDSTVIQHADLFPTILSLTGAEVKGKFFGRNVFDTTAVHDVLNYNYAETYLYLRDHAQMHYNDKRTGPMYFYAYPSDSTMKHRLRDKINSDHDAAVIKAKLQAYFQNMEDNTWEK